MSSIIVYGQEHKEILYLQHVAVDINAVTASSATIRKNTYSYVDSSRTTRTLNITDSDIPILTSSADSIALNNEADDTAFDEEFALKPRRTFELQYIYINICAGMNVSAYSSGNFVMSNVLIDVVQYTAGSQYPIVTNLNYATGHSNLGATRSQLFIVRDAPNISRRVLSPLDTISVRLRTTVSLGTGTSQQGFCPVFPYNAVATLKDWSVSSVIFKGVGVEE